MNWIEEAQAETERRPGADQGGPSICTTNQDELWKLYTYRDDYVRQEVAKRIEDQDRLWQMRNDYSSWVRLIVAQRVKGEDRLMEMLSNEDDPLVRRTIEERLFQVNEENTI